MLDESKPFTRADAVAAGISSRSLSSARYRRLFHNVYVSASALADREQRVSAALLAHPEGAWLSHTSAAEIRGIAVPKDPNVHVSVVEAKDRRWAPGLKP